MTITIHHLGVSQSERIIFLCEELHLPYTLQKHVRDPLAAPETLKSIPGNATGKAPFIVDDAVSPSLHLSESSAICEYICETYGSGHLIKKVGDAGFVSYTYWFNYISGSLHPTMSTAMLIGVAGLLSDSFLVGFSKNNVSSALTLVDERLGAAQWFAGEDFTAADVMAMYTLSTGRYWTGVNVKQYKNILRWLGDVRAREAYQRAMEKGDPEMRLLSGEEELESLLQLGGVGNDMWKKKA